MVAKQTTLTRFRADILLLIVAIIWGTGFIAQKLGMDGLGPLAFIAARFTLASVSVVPFVWRELKNQGGFSKADTWPLVALCATFLIGVIFQQVGLVTTTATNGGFLTSLYVIFVPFIAWVSLKQKPQIFVWPGCALALGGTWLLNGGSLDAFSIGDWLIFCCAICFAIHVVLMGFVMRQTEKPFAVSALQYVACAVVAWVGVAMFEDINIDMLRHNAWALAYAGIISSGVAFTLQAIAQRFTPASDAAVILSGEALFAALSGFLILGERLPLIGWVGCALIFIAILLVELGVYLFKPRIKA